MNFAFDAVRNHVALRLFTRLFLENTLDKSAWIMDGIDMLIEMVIEIKINPMVDERIVNPPKEMSGHVLGLDMEAGGNRLIEPHRYFEGFASQGKRHHDVDDIRIMHRFGDGIGVSFGQADPIGVHDLLKRTEIE